MSVVLPSIINTCIPIGNMIKRENIDHVQSSSSPLFPTCRDYGLYPAIPNSGESNFLLTLLFVGAAHTLIR